jgi:hypothetical protein
MSLLHGLFLSTLQDAKTQSNHSLLMEFYQLDKDISHNYETRTYKACFHDLSLYFMEARATAILFALGIK